MNDALLILWRELPDWMDPLPSNADGTWNAHPSHMYLWRWFVADVNVDRHYASGTAKSRAAAIKEAYRIAKERGITIRGETSHRLAEPIGG